MINKWNPSAQSNHLGMSFALRQIYRKGVKEGNWESILTFLLCNFALCHKAQNYPYTNIITGEVANMMNSDLDSR